MLTARLAGLALALAVAAAILLPGTLVLAHGGPAVVTVETRIESGTAVVTATVTYRDGDPINDAVLRTVADDGARSVPIGMVRTAVEGQYLGTASLSAGTWRITVRSAGEAPGTGSALLTVGAAEPPESSVGGRPSASADFSVRTEPSASPSATAAPGAGSPIGGSGIPAWLWTVLAVAGTAVAVVSTRRRARRIHGD